MVEFILAILSYMLINNVLLMQFLGICPFLGVSKKLNNAVGMSLAVIFVMMMASAITYPLYFYILKPLEIEYLDTICFIVVIATLVQIVELVLKKFLKGLYKSLGIYLPLITTNCAILGVAQSNISSASNFFNAMTISLGTGLGFMLVMVLFSAIREKLESNDIPESFKGVPIALITAGILALAFMGLTGLI